MLEILLLSMSILLGVMTLCLFTLLIRLYISKGKGEPFDAILATIGFISGFSLIGLLGLAIFIASMLEILN